MNQHNYINLTVLSSCWTVSCLALIFIVLPPPESAGAATIEFESILKKAIENSYDLQIAATDIELKTIRVDEAFSAYYPSVSMRLVNEYLHNLDHDSAQNIVIGDTVISGATSTYQHSLAFSLNYNLFDFGVRGLKYDNIKRDVDISKMFLLKSRIDTATRLLELYAEGLKLATSNASYESILQQQQEIYSMLQRLFESGTVRKINVVETAIDLAENVKRLVDNKMRLQRILKEITCFTQQDYDPATTIFADFADSLIDADRQPDISKMPEIIALDVVIEKKSAEYDIAVLERYPKLSLYSEYKLYGKDDNDFYDSFSDLSRKNASVGIVVDLPLFQGFASYHKARGLHKEIDKLKLQRLKRVAELKTDIDSLLDSDRLYRSSSKDRRDSLEKAGQMEDMARRMTEQQLTERVYYLQKQVEFIEKQLDGKLQHIDWTANSLRLKFLAQGAES